MPIDSRCSNNSFLFGHMVVMPQFALVGSYSIWTVSVHSRRSKQSDASISHTPGAAEAILDQFRYAFVHCVLFALGKSKYIECRFVNCTALW